MVNKTNLNQLILIVQKAKKVYAPDTAIIHIAKALKIPLDIKKVKYSFSANTVKNQADAAVAAAYGGVML